MRKVACGLPMSSNDRTRKHKQAQQATNKSPLIENDSLSKEPGDNQEFPPSRRMADGCLLLVAIIWGLNMPVMKFALGRMDEFLFNAIRLTLSTIVLGLCVGWKSHRVSTRRRRTAGVRSTARQGYLKQDWFSIFGFSFLAGFAYQVCFLLGINQTSAGNTALIMSAIPVWTAALSFLFLAERLARAAWTGLLIAFAGVLVVTFGKPTLVVGQTMAGGSLAGNLIVSLAGLSWAIASVISRPLMKRVSPLSLAFYSVSLTLPLHFVIAGPTWHDFQVMFSDPWVLAAVTFSGVFSTGFAYAMFNYGVQQLGASHAAGFQNVVPLIALVASWFLISEMPYPLQLAGGALIIAGLVLLRRNR